MDIPASSAFLTNFSPLDFSKALERAGATNYPIHIKLDTGMHRMGFVESEIPKLIESLKSNEIFFIRSIFSHLAGSDEAVFDALSHDHSFYH